MRILHVIHGLPPEKLGGAEVYTRNVASAQASAGHQVAIFTTSLALGAAGTTAATTEQSADGVTIVRSPIAPARAAENPAAQLWHTVRDRAIEAHFASLLASFRPDLLHVQHLQGMSAALLRQAVDAGVHRRVLTLHDFWFYCANSQLRRPGNESCDGPSAGCRNCVDCMTLRADLQPLRTLRPVAALPLAWRNRYLASRLRDAQILIAPSHFLRARYIEQGVAPADILVLENGIEPSSVGGTALELPTGGTRFLYVGTLAPHKGVHLLVEAFNCLPPEASLTIIGGEGPEVGYVERLRLLAKHPRIHFAGPQPQAVVHATLRAADCLVVPSLWYENSPLVVQEAFAAGLPVVASRLGALPEKVVDGVSGRLFEPGNVDDLTAHLLALHTHPSLMSALRPGVRSPVPMTEHATALMEIYLRAGRT